MNKQSRIFLFLFFFYNIYNQLTPLSLAITLAKKNLTSSKKCQKNVQRNINSFWNSILCKKCENLNSKLRSWNSDLLLFESKIGTTLQPKLSTHLHFYFVPLINYRNRGFGRASNDLYKDSINLCPSNKVTIILNQDKNDKIYQGKFLEVWRAWMTKKKKKTQNVVVN